MCIGDLMTYLLDTLDPVVLDAIGVAGFGLYVLNYTLVTFRKLQTEQIVYFFERYSGGDGSDWAGKFIQPRLCDDPGVLGRYFDCGCGGAFAQQTCKSARHGAAIRSVKSGG